MYRREVDFKTEKEYKRAGARRGTERTEIEKGYAATAGL